jgi:hypothetical protein
MIIFSADKLRKALANDSLDSWAKAKYMIFVIAMYGMSGPFYWFAPSFGPKKPLPYYVASSVSYVLTILFMVHGAKKCFRMNKTGDGKDFVERLAALYVPMTFEFIPVAASLFLITACFSVYVLPFDKETNYRVFSYLTLLLTPILMWLFFVLLHRSFESLVKLIKKQNGSS